MLSTPNVLYLLSGVAGLFLAKDFIVRRLPGSTKQTEQKELKLYAKIMPLEITQVQRYIKVSGNLSYRGFVKVKSERRGKLQYLNQNQFARAGDVLLKLDSETEEASLVRYTGSLNKAKYTLERAKERARQPGTVSESEMKTYESEYQIALGDKKRAESELRKMTILAPFDGKIGIYNFSLGSYVNESDIICTYVSHEDMIVDFTVSEIEALNVYPGKKLLVSSNLFGDKLFLNAIVEKVDPSTDVTYGIRVRARVNQEGSTQMTAGSAVTVSVSIDNDHPVPNVPEKALEERSGINYLNIATPNDDGSFTVYKTPVDVQARVNGIAILSMNSNKDKIYYALPEPGTNLDGKKVLPKEGSDLSALQQTKLPEEQAKAEPEAQGIKEVAQEVTTPVAEATEATQEQVNKEVKSV